MCSRPNPCPADHPFWDHPRIVVTLRSVAALTNPVTAAEAIAANLRRLAAGENFPDRIDLGCRVLGKPLFPFVAVSRS